MCPELCSVKKYSLKENLAVIIDGIQLADCYWAPQLGKDIKVRLFIEITKKKKRA